MPKKLRSHVSAPVTGNPAAEIEQWLKDPKFREKAQRAQRAARDALYRVTRIPEDEDESDD